MGRGNKISNYFSIKASPITSFTIFPKLWRVFWLLIEELLFLSMRLYYWHLPQNESDCINKANIEWSVLK